MNEIKSSFPSRSPAQLAWRRLRKNRTALCGAVLLALLYVLALFAAFFSPYSPTETEFRTHFFHPPTKFYFKDSQGNFSLRPHCNSTILVDKRSLIYAEGDPLYLGLKIPSENLNPYAAEVIEEIAPIIRVINSSNKTIGTASSLTETGPNTGTFLGGVPLPAEELIEGNTLIARTNSEVEISIKIQESPQGSSSSELFVADSHGNPIRGYILKRKLYPVQFFVRSWKYNFLWFIQTDLHLFGIETPAHIFLFGTDQTGRDLFSRILHGARISMTVGLVGVLLTTILGLFIGGVAGYYGGFVDSALMRFAELILSIPALYLILTLRNIIPDQLGQSYEKIRQFGLQTFEWQNSPLMFVLVVLIIVLLLSYYNYRKMWNRTGLFISCMILMFVALGPKLINGFLIVLETMLPASTHLTSDWTYFLIILILTTVGWASMARVIRGMVLSLREEEYVLAARATGANDARVLLSHILPNTFGFVIVRATLLIPAYILGEVALSFLGVGVQEPVASWGNMLSAAQNLRVLQQFSWALAPGFFLFITVLAFNFLGDGLRDALDPRA